MNSIFMIPEGMPLAASIFDRLICAAMLAIPVMMFWALSQQGFFY